MSEFLDRLVAASAPKEVTPSQLILHRSELDLIAAFAGCSLDEKPGSNWV
jgi:hypothetical protein